MIQIETFDKEKHYETIERFWRWHGFPSVPAVFLPALGVVALQDGLELAFAWVYLDNSCPVAKLEWCTTNPEASALAAARALNVCIDFLKRRAKELGYAYMITTAHHGGLIKVLEKHGFIKTDLQMTHLGIILDEKVQADYVQAIGRGDPIHAETILGAASS